VGIRAKKQQRRDLGLYQAPMTKSTSICAYSPFARARQRRVYKKGT
jgi:hypothetical protein